mmetsp:Transcript_4299/g.5934  ORF Transcript_4299/g.5934 Transcript_4299/m.5934 type:complete len:84 (+) Transcript_4299:35-286(+)
MEMLCYLFELAYDVAISPNDNGSANLGFEGVDPTKPSIQHRSLPCSSKKWRRLFVTCRGLSWPHNSLRLSSSVFRVSTPWLRR